MSILTTKPISGAKPGAGASPAWLDQVLGCLSPPFSFRNGGSAITGPGASAQQHAALRPAAGTASADSGEVAQGFRFDGAHHSEMMSPSSRSLAGV
jgi:hypothetical protein